MSKNLLDYVGLGYFLEKIKTLFVTGLGTSGNNLTWTKNGTTNNITIPYAHKSSELVPLQTKQYTGVIGTANDLPGTTFYFMSVLPENRTKPCTVKYRIYASMEGLAEGIEESIVTMTFSKNAVVSYDVWNYIANTSYRPYYYHYRYLSTLAGHNSGYGHLIGVGMRYSYNPTTAANARTYVIDILDIRGGTVTFFDTMLKFANVPGTGATNYSGESTYDAVTNGETHLGDRNDVNYQNREYYGARKTNAALYRYMICLTKSDGSLVPINSVNNSVATTKTLTTDSFDPFGDIFFWSSTTTYTANANVGDGSWYRQIVCDLRYSFNCGGYDATGILVARSPLYLVAVPQADGTAVLHSSPLSQALPNTEDGLIYIYLGMVYVDTYPYRVVLSLNHPVYYYKNGAARLWTNEQDPIFSASPAAGITSANITSWNGKVDKITSTDNAVVRFDGTTGAVQNSYVKIDDSGNVTMTNDATIKLVRYNNRNLTITGNNITHDMTNATGGYAGSFYSLITKGSDNEDYTTTGLGFYGGNTNAKGLSYLYVASPSKTYSNPDIKFNVDGTTDFLSSVTAPTATKGTNTTQIATTAFVQTAVGDKQDIISDLATIRSGASAGATAYQKPSGGIPKTDLASAVQTSLEKADTALLSHQDISGKENTSNKVTSLSSSSTDTLYPSARCVYDLIKDSCVFIEGSDVYLNF